MNTTEVLERGRANVAVHFGKQQLCTIVDHVVIMCALGSMLPADMQFRMMLTKQREEDGYEYLRCDPASCKAVHYLARAALETDGGTYEDWLEEVVGDRDSSPAEIAGCEQEVVYSFNDQASLKEVLRMFDRAIAMSKNPVVAPVLIAEEELVVAGD